MFQHVLELLSLQAVLSFLKYLLSKVHDVFYKPVMREILFILRFTVSECMFLIYFTKLPLNELIFMCIINVVTKNAYKGEHFYRQGMKENATP
jgi:hypothetical protein